MNNKNFSYIQFELNRTSITDEILNRIFCPDGGKWVLLDDEKAKEIKLWIQKTKATLKSEKRKAMIKAIATSRKRGKDFESAGCL